MLSSAPTVSSFVPGEVSVSLPDGGPWNLYRHADDDSTWQLVAESVIGRYIDDDLAPDLGYAYAVRKVNADGNPISARSQESHVVVAAAEPDDDSDESSDEPGDPGLAAEPGIDQETGESNVTISFPNDGVWNVYRRAGDEDWQLVGEHVSVVPGDDVFTDADGLDPDTGYQYAVSPIYADGSEGEMSEPIDVTTESIDLLTEIEEEDGQLDTSDLDESVIDELGLSDLDMNDLEERDLVMEAIREHVSPTLKNDMLEDSDAFAAGEESADAWYMRTAKSLGTGLALAGIVGAGGTDKFRTCSVGFSDDTVSFYSPDQERDGHGRWSSDSSSEDDPGHQITDTTFDKDVATKVFSTYFPRESYDTAMQKIAKVSGAPAGSKVSIEVVAGKNVRINFSNGAVGQRLLLKDSDGKKYIFNDSLEVKAPGKGLGAKIFSQQVKQAAAAGFDRMETYAYTDSDHNGGYTWAVLGYDSPLNSNSIVAGELSKITNAFPNAKTISDVLASPGGVDWWRKNNVSFSGTFDLKEGSLSRKTLDEYMKAKASGHRPALRKSLLSRLKGMVGLSAKDSEPREEPDFNDDDHDILRELWRKRAEQDDDDNDDADTAEFRGPSTNPGCQAEDLLSEQLDYLDGFADDLASGKATIDTAKGRLGMYANSLGVTIGKILHLRAEDAGMKWGRRSLAEGYRHCACCVSEAARGWVPLEEVVPIGDCQCMANCACSLEYSAAAENPQDTEEPIDLLDDEGDGGGKDSAASDPREYGRRLQERYDFSVEPEFAAMLADMEQHDDADARRVLWYARRGVERVGDRPFAPGAIPANWGYSVRRVDGRVIHDGCHCGSLATSETGRPPERSQE